MNRWTERSCSHFTASVIAGEERGNDIYTCINYVSLLHVHFFTDHTPYAFTLPINQDIVSDLSVMFGALLFIQGSVNGVHCATDSNNVGHW